jgi:transposase-like protein
MFPVSYRDPELMLLDRGVEVDHTTIFRWIQAYAAELVFRDSSDGRSATRSDGRLNCPKVGLARA